RTGRCATFGAPFFHPPPDPRVGQTRGSGIRRPSKLISGEPIGADDPRTGARDRHRFGAGGAGSWIVARTEPQREQTARRFLELGGFSVYIPRIRERHAKGGRRMERLRPLFPSYAFIALRGGRWWNARWCVGVVAIIMSGGEPARLSDRIVDEI